MICLLICSDKTIGGVVECSPADRHKVDAMCMQDGHCVELDDIKFANSQLPSGVKKTTLHLLADDLFYFTELDTKYEFSKEEPSS